MVNHRMGTEYLKWVLKQWIKGTLVMRREVITICTG